MPEWRCKMKFTLRVFIVLWHYDLLHQCFYAQNPVVINGTSHTNLLVLFLFCHGMSFVECDEVKAVVSIGCCYNLLSEGGAENVDSQSGFPMSKGVKHAGLLLGKSSRDLACQSAERWKALERDAGLHNFELHAFRAAFQMVFTAILFVLLLHHIIHLYIPQILPFSLPLSLLLILLSSTNQSFGILKVLFRYYPEVLITSPSIGRQGKAFRRQQNWRILESPMQHASRDFADSLSEKNCTKKGNPLTNNLSGARTDKNESTSKIDPSDSTLKFCDTADSVGAPWGTDGLFPGFTSFHSSKCEEAKLIDKYSLFDKFCRSGLQRLGLHYSKETDFARLWKETEPFSDLIGPYWSLRAALGPVLETIILLDRLLFLQEHDNSLEAVMLPIFDPTLSPRNVALIAKKL
ncbi:hypothetical protein U1Q18_000155 [Sarracenia purpurea var. burkii]